MLEDKFIICLLSLGSSFHDLVSITERGEKINSQDMEFQERFNCVKAEAILDTMLLRMRCC